MNKCLYPLLLISLSLMACAAVYTDASNANQVTYLNSSDESIAQLSQKAALYCAQYGKVASFRKTDSALVAVFDCHYPK
jgi:putative hemolysin